MLNPKRLLAWGTTALLLALTAGCTVAPDETLPDSMPDGSTADSVHLSFGNPSNAGEDDPENYLMVKPQYALSYNDSKRIANWVSWQLGPDWIGEAERQDDFRPDETLPEGFYQVTPRDYRQSGYDRGHLAPSADRTATEGDNSSTFVMTNMIPQAPDNNQQTWRGLEDYSRDLVEEGNELYIVAGSYGEQKRIGNGQVVVPTNTWKVVVVLEPGSGIEDITEETRVIAVDVPNQDGIDPDWETYSVSVDEIEAATGYDFLSAVPTETQEAIESRVSR
ncbi:DNA/RNA non-specific endonuclease [Oculatella sp. FACHB-28]|uniref:DNA/RNA non-specific endonuclease n=1 Tax=Oculatella sp. FACHB-28 TaxID=2692845 RepID=UPI0016828439|nr:DNA/RNA non-specific endonuclease [Oculatella sp. FACHB-28]MBD2057806.1 DNA/RNA non-specific endonuclease [Oculatella sp. FACHB-28]